ncbi:chemotaxis protein CheX [Motilimonas eburnea]|uniref:chemotaxis protein CheX n=1 Tax=Motilimonas eburnea TaxID=1737488 RepID=UPI001E51406C|nr:chemotaxis protein CheX [Motilimonas eburnea]MCE2572160.1 chemotaxis protein CheX [Motilimonas eburnea]
MIIQAEFEAVVGECWQHFCDIKSLPFVLSELLQCQDALVLGAWVEFVNNQHGVVVLASSEVGTCLAQAMFGGHRERLTAKQVTDAMGEITNIIAGHVKTKLAMSDNMAAPVSLSRQQIAHWIGEVESVLPCALLVNAEPVYVFYSPCLKQPSQE